jgi:spore coat protein CotF
MPVNLTQKEKMILQDQKNAEQVCIEKYNNYASQAQDPQLKQLFQSYASQEQQHLDTLNQILSGQVPNMMGQQQNQQQGQTTQQMGMQSSMQGAMGGQGDAMLCNDALMTEKHVSSAYNTAVFEFRDSGIRQALNHIQKEEQQHGEGIFNYMQSKGMYNPQ